MKLNFDYGTTNNNGNVQSQTITVPTTGQTAGFTAVQTYNYDELNRLKSAAEIIGGAQSWKQTYIYDRYGNRTFDTANTTTIEAGCPTAVCNPQVDPNTNRLIGYTFDTVGNTTVDANGRTFTYDGENKQTKVVSGGNIVGEYFYDGDGKRVKKKAGSEVTIFVYDASGKMVAEYSTTVAPLSQARVSYLTTDHLGSPRITTDANGKVFSRRDFMPFGEELDSSITPQRNVNLNYGEDGLRNKFTSYERDKETDLDFAQARYYAKNFGRFYSADNFVNDTNVVDPASWNLYAYARNNPLYLVDPEGERVYAGYITDADERADFLRRANYTYGCDNCVDIGNDGYLTVDTTGLSEEIINATQFLTDAINSTDLSKLFNVEITNGDQDVEFGDSGTRKGVPVTGADGKVRNTSAINIRLDFNDDAFVQGNAEVKASFLNLIFAHEISHFSPTFQQDSTAFGSRGPVVNQINQIRLARGLSLRYEYPGHDIAGAITRLKFGNVARDPKFGFVFQGADGIEVDEDSSKVLFWVQHRVKGR